MIYIIILTYNGLPYLPKLFASLAVLDYSKYKILVLDSGSLDGSVMFLEKLKEQGQIELIKFKKNPGFCVGNNLGMQYALNNGAQNVVLLNQDTEVEPNFLAELVRVAESDEKIGVVQSLLIYNDKKTINSLGNQIHFLGYGWCEGNYEKNQNSMKAPLSSRNSAGWLSDDNHKTQGIKEITYASGAAVLYKAEMLQKIGLFDENYFAYNEDMDLCIRARMAGYKTVLAPQSIVYHDYHFPTSKNKKRYFWMEKNRLYFIFKFYHFKTLFLIWPMMLAMDLGQFINALRKGYFMQYLWSRWWFLFHLKKILKARREIQQARRIGDKELLKNFASEIKYQPVNNFLLDQIGNPVMKWYWKLIKKII